MVDRLAQTELDLARAREDLDAASRFIRVIGEELALAGYETGDRTTILRTLRAVVKLAGRAPGPLR